MPLLVEPASIKGHARAPASKSHAIRAIAAACLAKGQSRIRNLSPSKDVLCALDCARSLGARVSQDCNDILIGGVSDAPREVILDCGESGLCLRLFPALAAALDIRASVTACGSLKARPSAIPSDTYTALGASVLASNAYPPFSVSGLFHGGEVSLSGAVSSQPISGLMMALPLARHDSLLHIESPRSAGYLSLTRTVLARFGIEVRISPDFRHIAIPGRQRYAAADIDVEGDFSGAAFLMCAAAMCGEICITNLNYDSAQPDRRILEFLARADVSLKRRGEALFVSQSWARPFDVDLTDTPDLFPPLCALATVLKRPSRFRGLSRLAHKESNRGQALVGEFNRIGCRLRIDEAHDALIVEAATPKGGYASSHGDHRIAMALALAGLASEEGVVIDEPDCVDKSFPGFFSVLDALKEV